MSKTARFEQRKHTRDEVIARWGGEQEVNVERLDDGQKWMVFFVLKVLAWIGGIAPLKRLLGCFLSHSEMGLSSVLIGKLIGCSDRNVRYNAEHSSDELWQRLSRPERGHPKPKLLPRHAGPLAKYLSEHSGAKVKDILKFISTKLAVDIKSLSLRRYIKRYGLGCLRDGKHEQAPLFWARPCTEVPLF